MNVQKILIAPFLGFIKIYQRFISPLTPASCRFQPTCSSYAKESFINHGLLKGLLLSVKRIGRCHPWGGSGYDPVPPRDHKDNTERNSV